MKAKKIFSKALVRYKNGDDIAIVTDYKKAKKIIKLFLMLPETKIRGIEINSSDWDGYDKAWLINVCKDGDFYCQKAINVNGSGKPLCNDDYTIVDKSAIGEFTPEEFVMDSSKIKVV